MTRGTAGNALLLADGIVRLLAALLPPARPVLDALCFFCAGAAIGSSITSLLADTAWSRERG